MSQNLITVDMSVLEDVQQRLGEVRVKAPNVISQSLNRTVNNVATNLSREVRQTYTIKAGDIKGTIKKVTSKPNTLHGSVTSSGGSIGLDKFKTSNLNLNFSHNKKRKPVKAAVKKGGLKTIVNGFAADVHGVKVFNRSGKNRLPIERQFGPSVPQMAGSPEIAKNVMAKAQDTFDKRLEANIQNLLKNL